MTSIIEDMGFFESICFGSIFIILGFLIFYLTITDSLFNEDSIALRINR